MADEAPQASGGFTGTLKSKWGPLPVWGWLALVTVLLLGYWLWTQHKSGAATSSSGNAANGPGAVGQPGVVVINQDEPGTDDEDTDPGKGKKPPKPPEGKPGNTRQITVTRNETLGDLAKQRHWSDATLKRVEQENITQGGGHWTASTRLKKGDEVLRPLRS